MQFARLRFRWIVLSALLPAAAARADDLATLDARVAELFARGDYPTATEVAARALSLAERQFGRDAAETATRVNDLGLLYKKQGDYARAEPLYERALAIRERTLGPDHELTAQSLNNLALLHDEQGRYERALKLYERALAAFEKSRGPEHPETATCLGNLASLHSTQGRHVQAEALYQRALAIDEKTVGPDHPDTAVVVNNLAGLYDTLGRYDEAERFYERALAIMRKSRGPEHPDTAQVLHNMALLAGTRGRHDRAEPLLEQAIAIREKALGPDHPLTAETLNGLALHHRTLGRYARAEPLYRRALAIRERTLGREHPDTGTVLSNLAALLDAQGQYDQALPFYERALAIFEKSLGPDHADVAVILGNLALLQEHRGRLDEAEALHERALAIRQRAFGPVHPDVAGTLGSLASLHESQGRYEQAEDLQQRALAISEKAVGPDHPDTALVLNNLALLADRRGRYDEAKPVYERALAIDERALGPDHPRTITILDNLAPLEAALGHWPAAVALTDRARRSTRRHVAGVLPSLAAAEQVEFLRTTYEANFHTALTIGLAQRANAASASLSAGWLANGKAVAQEATAQRIILARQLRDPRTAALVQELETVRAELSRLDRQTPGPTRVAAHHARIRKLKADEQQLVHEIGGQIASLDRPEPWVEVDDIRRRLPATSVLIDIARFRVFDFKATGQDPRWLPARYAAWIVPPAGKGDVRVLDLGPAAAIDAAVTAYREALDTVRREGFGRGQATLEDELTGKAAPLAAQVLQPIVEAVGDAAEIVLSPDGALWLVPWQALPLADGRYVIERFCVRTVTSGRDLLPLQADGRRARGGSVVVADPAYDPAPEPGTQPPDDPGRSRAWSADRGRLFPRLAGTRAEALASRPAIKTLTGGDPEMLLGDDATEAKVKRAASRARTVVLATHGYFLPDQEVGRDGTRRVPNASGGPRTGTDVATRAVTVTGEQLEDPLLRCGLALAGANATTRADGDDDGILTGAEIVGLDLLGTDLVVLSACETGVGRVHVGEGVAGLRQAFLIAGAGSVVATLWQVPDAESTQLMMAFFGHLSGRMPAAAALRAAQLEFIERRRVDRNYEAAHPYLWAAYGVTGR